MGFLPKIHRLLFTSCYLVPGFTPSTARLVHNNIISKEVCRVFVLRCQSASRLTCRVMSHRVHRSYTVRTVIQITFRHLYIHTLILSHIHTQHIHNINSYMVASVTQCLVISFRFSLQLFQAASPKQRTA